MNQFALFLIALVSIVFILVALSGIALDLVGVHAPYDGLWNAISGGCCFGWTARDAA